MLARYRCKDCGVEAEIDKENRTVVIHYRPGPPSIAAAIISPSGFHFPLHPDCELVKDIDSIKFGKLEEVK